jgi:hypothetical protein
MAHKKAQQTSLELLGCCLLWAIGLDQMGA